MHKFNDNFRCARVYGEIKVWNQFVGEDKEPAMVIARSRPGARKAAYVIALSSAYKYINTETHEHNAFMANAAPRIAEFLGFFISGHSNVTHKIADVIIEELDQLLQMPPYQAFGEENEHDDGFKGAVADCILKADGKVAKEFEL